MSSAIKIEYEFRFESGETKTYSLQLDPHTIALISQRDESETPEWTELEVEQCAHCPLTKASHKHCPIAANLQNLVATFKDCKSHDEVLVNVKTAERDYQKRLPLQVGLFSVFGAIMATSGCPKMDFLKPMARFHLPFSSTEETIVRAASTYLLRQFFELQKGGEPDFEMNKLDALYRDVQIVNQGMIRRMNRLARSGDANHNSITTLDCFSKLLSMALNKKLSSYSYLFEN